VNRAPLPFLDRPAGLMVVLVVDGLLALALLVATGLEGVAERGFRAGVDHRYRVPHLAHPLRLLGRPDGDPAAVGRR
jgi:hypothetical protein